MMPRAHLSLEPTIRLPRWRRRMQASHKSSFGPARRCSKERITHFGGPPFEAGPGPFFGFPQSARRETSSFLISRFDPQSHLQTGNFGWFPFGFCFFSRQCLDAPDSSPEKDLEAQTHKTDALEAQTQLLKSSSWSTPCGPRAL